MSHQERDQQPQQVQQRQEAGGKYTAAPVRPKVCCFVGPESRTKRIFRLSSSLSAREREREGFAREGEEGRGVALDGEA